ncbi:LuxR C-terminal-related transcriptional regulator [Brevibacillus halotolerans]|nr:LuxR C-terminal-related transcriptional regulator [Brevibacillus halotolerans]
MVIGTKLLVPRTTSAFVSRKELFRRLDQALSLPITLIVAPACYGKTTSVGLWIKENLKCVGWLSLDTQDNEYIRFWSHLIASLEVVLPGLTEKCSHILDKGYQDSFSLIKTLIEHMQLVKKTVVFVLDDLHLIYRNDILESLTWLIEYLPHHVHVLITARTEPPLPIVKWRARGHILQLGVHDLQFKKEETRVFFHECANLHLTDQEIEILVSKTEGWIGGMNLIALSMTEKIDFSKRIHQINGLHRDISDFLFNEVFQLLPDELQLFLLQISLLKNMNSSLCDTITGRSDSQSILEKLEKMNLFITPLDDNRSWYRFHMLFSEFLRNHFAYKYPEKASEIYQAAGRWMEKSNSFEEAVDYYLAGEHFLDASRLIEELMPLLYQGRYHLLAGWIKELPERYLLDRSSLHLISTSLIIEQEGVQKADKYLENVSKHYQTIKCTLSRENINEYEFQLLGCRGLVSLFKGEADKFLQLVEEKIERFDQRAFEFLGILYDDREIKVTASPNDSLKEVMDFISRFIEIEERSAYCKETPHLGTLYTYWADMKYKCNELDEAQVYVNKGYEYANRFHMLKLFIYSSLIQAKIHLAEGRCEAAIDILQESIEKAAIDHPNVIRKVYSQMAMIWLEQEDARKANEYMQLVQISADDDIHPQLVMDYLGLLKCFLAKGKTTQALRLLRKVLMIVSELRQTQRMTVTLTHARVMFQIGKMKKAFHLLEDVLVEVEKEGCIRMILDEGKPILQLLQRYVTMRKKSLSSSNAPLFLTYLETLLQQFKETIPLNEKENILTKQETAILRILSTGLTNVEIAKELCISKETVKTHINNIFRKLDVSNRVQAASVAKEQGFLD